MVIHGHVTKWCHPQSLESLSGYILSVTVVEPSLRPSAALELWNIPNASLMTVGGKRIRRKCYGWHNGFYKGRVTVSVNHRTTIGGHPCISIDWRSGNVTDALEAQSGPLSRISLYTDDHGRKSSRQCYDRPVSSKEVFNSLKLAWRCYGLGLPRALLCYEGNKKMAFHRFWIDGHRQQKGSILYLNAEWDEGGGNSAASDNVGCGRP